MLKARVWVKRESETKNTFQQLNSRKLLDGIEDKIMDPLAIFWVLTNSSYLGKYNALLVRLSLSAAHFFLIYDDDCKNKKRKFPRCSYSLSLLGLMPIG